MNRDDASYPAITPAEIAEGAIGAHGAPSDGIDRDGRDHGRMLALKERGALASKVAS